MRPCASAYSSCSSSRPSSSSSASSGAFPRPRRTSSDPTTPSPPSTTPGARRPRARFPPPGPRASQPRGSTAGTAPPSFVASPWFPVADLLIIDRLVVDTTTGALSLVPWKDAHALTAVGDTVVVCDGDEACSGWTLEASSWELTWSSATGHQNKEKPKDEQITYPDRPVIGSGDEATVVVPVDVAREAPQVVHPRTAPHADFLTTRVLQLHRLSSTS